MDKLITLCRDVEEPATDDCIDDHEDLDRPLIAPCKVERIRCDLQEDRGMVGAEADSSATRREERAGECCEC